MSEGSPHRSRQPGRDARRSSESRARYTVFGAGSIGTVLAGLLADAGIEVAIAGRNAVPRLRLEGDDETVNVRVRVVDEPEGTILLCVHAPEVEDLCEGWPGLSVVTWQNGVSSETTAAKWCRVIGGVWRMTCTLVKPGISLFTRRGRVIVGRHPGGIDDEVEAVAADLRAAGLDVGISPRIAGDKWLKLALNVASTPNALVRKLDHARPEFGAIKSALIEEARDVFAANGVDARSGDGGDLAIEQEIEKHKETVVRDRTVYNQTWRALSLGRQPKEVYHDIIVELADGHAPRNAAMLELVRRATAPECYTVEAVFNAVVGTASGSRGSP